MELLVGPRVRTIYLSLPCGDAAGTCCGILATKNKEPQKNNRQAGRKLVAYQFGPTRTNSIMSDAVTQVHLRNNPDKLQRSCGKFTVTVMAGGCFFTANKEHTSQSLPVNLLVC